MSIRPPTAAEELRQLTREAHAATKDLRAAVREGRAERDALESRLGDHLNSEINRVITIYEDALEGRAEIQWQRMIEQLGQIIAYLDRMVGVTTPEQLRAEIIELIMHRLTNAFKADLAAVNTDEITITVPAGIARPVRDGLPGLGHDPVWPR